MWTGSYSFLLRNLIMKDFKIRYRNMSLGVFWSLLNPLVMMAVYTFVFRNFFNTTVPHFAEFLLCGIVPFNFFVAAWGGATVSLIDNAALIKHVPVPREVIPIAGVLSSSMHLLIQIALLLILIVSFGNGINIYWLWLPVIWALGIVFVSGLTLITSSLSVYSRDIRYVVESINTLMFWFVPIIYSFAIVPVKYRGFYQYNPLAAEIIALRSVLLDGQAPSGALMLKFVLVSAASLGIGLLVFHKLKARFYDYL